VTVVGWISTAAMRMFVRNFVVISPNKPVAKKLEPGGLKIYRLVSSSASH
jgi:hypothetical protein